MKQIKPLKPKQNLIALFISAAGFIVYFWFIDRSFIGKLSSAVAIPLVLIYGIASYFWEKNADKKAHFSHPDLLDGSYFSSPDWREKFLEYSQSKGWDKVKSKSMKADVCRRSNNGYSRAAILYGSFFTVCGIALLFSPFSVWKSALILIFGAAILSYAIYRFTGGHFRKWLKSFPGDINELEHSYMTGKLLVFKNSGINIGNSYTFYFRKKTCGAFPVNDIVYANRKIVHLKKYQNSLFAGDEYLHFLVVKNRSGSCFEVQLNEFQVEMALNELNLLINSSDSKNEIVESFDNSIITP